MENEFGKIPKDEAFGKIENRTPYLIDDNLVKLADPGGEAVMELLLNHTDEATKEFCEQQNNGFLFLVILHALTEDKTIREICEQYYLKEVSDGPLVNFCENPRMEKLEYSGHLKLVRRYEPIEIPDEEWQNFVGKTLLRLQQKLEIKC